MSAKTRELNNVKLTRMMQAFVTAFVANGGDGTRAAIDAGCKPSNAAAVASRWLTMVKIQDSITEARNVLVIRTRFTPDRVLRELKTMAFSDVSHYTFDEMTGRLSLAEDAPKDAMRAVSSVKYRIETDKAGNTIRTVEFKLWDKPGTLKLAGKHVGLFADKDAEAIKVEALKLMVDEVKRAEERKRLAAAEATTVDVVTVEPKADE